MNPTSNTSWNDSSTQARKIAKPLLGIALFALLLHDVFGAHGFVAMRRTQRQIRQIREQIVKLKTDNDALSKEVEALKTDPKAIERIAREDMGLARPGELIYRLPDSAKPTDHQDPGSHR